jgi:hypothetical protein
MLFHQSTRKLKTSYPETVYKITQKVKYEIDRKNLLS